jgi:hypothetical protein
MRKRGYFGLLGALLVGIAGCGGGNGSGGQFTAVTDREAALPVVRLTWTPQLFGKDKEVVEYHIWRRPEYPYNLHETPIESVTVSTTSYTHRPAHYTFWNGVNGFGQIYPPDFGLPASLGFIIPSQGSITGFPAGNTSVN